MKHLQTLLAVIAGLALASRRFLFGDERLIAANTNPDNVGTHDGTISRLPDAAIATRNLLHKVGSDADHTVVCGANAVPLGTINDEATAADVTAANVYVAVDLLGKGPTKRMVASEAISAGVLVFTAASGKVSLLSASAGTYYCVGTALTAASADGDIIEVADCSPIKTVVA